MPTIGLHRDFLPQYAKLANAVQRKVDEILGSLGAHSHTDLCLEEITGAKDPRIRTVRITDSWCGVVVILSSGKSYLLLNVLPREKAAEWARGRRVTENSASGGIEVRDDLALASATAGLRRTDAAPAEGSKLFDDVPDDDLARLGIDDDIRTLCKLMRCVDQLDALGSLIPEQQYDVLTGLAAGLKPEAVWQEIAQNPVRAGDTDRSEGDPAEHDSPSAAMRRSQGYIVVVNDSRELAEVLECPFELWRVFLHPSQQRIVDHPPYNGPARVTGGAGTGKTVVALHRARHLARNSPLPEKSILLTTFTKNLGMELHRNLDVLIADPVVRARIEVTNVDVLARRYFQERHGRAANPLSDSDVNARWQRLSREHGTGLPESFLNQEWREVVLGQRITTAEGYREADRRGRGKALSPTEKDQLWAVFEAFRKQLREEGNWTFDEIADEAVTALSKHTAKPYRHVIVDEAQDLHPSRWRMLRALVDPSSDDLFLAGDTHQRIYSSRVSLRSLGIHVSGRSSKLRINYRTSREILLWSTALLLGERVDDMGEGEENLVGYRSSFRGYISGEFRGTCSNADGAGRCSVGEPLPHLRDDAFELRRLVREGRGDGSNGQHHRHCCTYLEIHQRCNREAGIGEYPYSAAG